MGCEGTQCLSLGARAPCLPSAGSLGLPWALRPPPVPRTPTSVSLSSRDSWFWAPCPVLFPTALHTAFGKRGPGTGGRLAAGCCILTRRRPSAPLPTPGHLLSALGLCSSSDLQKLGLSLRGGLRPARASQDTPLRPALPGEERQAGLSHAQGWRRAQASGVLRPPGSIPGPHVASPQPMSTLLSSLSCSVLLPRLPAPGVSGPGHGMGPSGNGSRSGLARYGRARHTGRPCVCCLLFAVSPDSSVKGS